MGPELVARFLAHLKAEGRTERYRQNVRTYYVRVAGPAPALTSLFVLAAVKDAGLPTNDVRVQGSALRKPTADDVDLAVLFVDEATFDKLQVDRFDGRAAFSETAPTMPKANPSRSVRRDS